VRGDIIYTPYVNAAGVQTAACFPVSFRVVLKSS